MSDADTCRMSSQVPLRDCPICARTVLCSWCYIYIYSPLARGIVRLLYKEYKQTASRTLPYWTKLLISLYNSSPSRLGPSVTSAIPLPYHPRKHRSVLLRSQKGNQPRNLATSFTTIAGILTSPMPTTISSIISMVASSYARRNSPPPH